MAEIFYDSDADLSIIQQKKVAIVGMGGVGMAAMLTALAHDDVRVVAVEDEEFKQAETAAGYAKPMSAEYQAKQAALVAEHIRKQDVDLVSRKANSVVTGVHLRMNKARSARTRLVRAASTAWRCGAALVAASCGLCNQGSRCKSAPCKAASTRPVAP